MGFIKYPKESGIYIYIYLHLMEFAYFTYDILIFPTFIWVSTTHKSDANLPAKIIIRHDTHNNLSSILRQCSAALTGY